MTILHGDMRFYNNIFAGRAPRAGWADVTLPPEEEEWNDLEIQCRRWARRYGEVYIACGPLFEGDDIKKIGRNKVHVPTGFFKVVLAKGKKPKAIGYIFENRRGSQGRVCTVDEIEDLTGMDFFSPLDDKIEEQVEAYANIRQW